MGGLPRAVALGLVLGGWGAAWTGGPARAQDHGHEHDRGDSSRIIQLEEEVVEGQIEKPEAFYILQPTNLDYEEAALEESFIPELLQTVEEPPF